jgi:hypothetical protein
MDMDRCQPKSTVPSTTPMRIIDAIKSFAGDELTKATQALRKVDEFVRDKPPRR